jgi:hypothetical protein
MIDIDSLVKILLNGEITTGWFFHPTIPYIISSGHQFQEDTQTRKKRKFNVEFRGDLYPAELIEDDFNSHTGYDYSISIVKGVKNYVPIPISMTDSLNPRTDVIMKGFSRSFEVEVPIAINGKFQQDYRKNNSGSAALKFQISDTGDLNKHGLSGSPICVVKNGGIQAFAIQVEQIKGVSSINTAFALRNLNKKDLIGDVLDYYESGKLGSTNFRKEISSSKHKKNRLGFILLPPMKDRKKNNYELYVTFIRRWFDFWERKRDKYEQDFVDINPLDIKYLNKKDVNFKKRSSFSNAINQYLVGNETKSDIRLVLDFTEVFDFNDFTLRDNCSHLVGLTLGETNKIVSTEVFDLIIQIDHKLKKETIRDIFYNLIEDIILDINFFNSFPELKISFYNRKLKKEFSKLKVKFASERNFSFYGDEIVDESIRYIPLGSILRQSYEGKYNHKQLQGIWSDFVNDYIPKISNHYESNNDSIIEVNNLSEIIVFLRNIPKLGGQLSKKKLEKKLRGLEKENMLIFAISTNRPNNKNKKDSITQLLTGDGRKRKDFKLKNFRFFKVQDNRLLIPFKENLTTILFKIKANN